MKEMQIKVQTFVGLYTIYSIKPDPDSKSFGKTEFPEILLVYNDNGATFPIRCECSHAPTMIQHETPISQYFAVYIHDKMNALSRF